jgi:hypothetical protein
MNIGNYKSAISGLRSGLAQLGLSMGVFQILKGSFNIVKDFEQGQADLASVLGINVDEMAALTEQAKKLGATTTFTATQVSELQKEYAKLGFSMTEIEAVTEATLSLAEATGTDLGRAAEVTGATIRGFGLSADETQRVVDVMAKSFSSSSLDMEKFATAMSAVAPVAKNAGFSIEQTTALIGTLTDRGIDASSAGTGLRNMFLDAKKNGLSFNEALEQVNGATDKTAKSFELFGKRGATLGVILAENGSSVDELTGKLKDSDGAAKKMADTQRNTLGGAIALLTSAWEGWILKMNEAGGAGEKLRKAIKFLADNFETIVYWVGMGVKAFLGFKIAMKAMQLSSFISKLGGVSGAFKEIGKGAKGSVGGIKGMSKALKGIGLGIAITLLLEMAKAFYDIASGAAEARRQQDLFNDAQAVGNAVAENFKKVEDERIKQKRQELELLVASNQLSQEDMDLQMHKMFLNKKEKAQNMVEGAKQEIFLLQEKNKIFEREIELRSEAAKGNADATIVANRTNKRVRETIQKNNERMVVQRVLMSSMQKVTSGVSDELHNYGVVIADNSDILNRSTHDIEKNTDALEKQALALKGLEVVTPEREDIELADTNLDQLERNSLEAEYNILIADVNQTEEERINLLTRQIIARAELEKYGKTEAEQQVINARMLKSINDLNVEEIKSTENLTKAKNDAIDLTTQYFIEQADKRIAKIDEEIDAATKQADHYRALAENGNITAKESLAEQNRLIAEANVKKEKEEKRKEQILMVSAVLKSFNSYLDGGDKPAEALAKAFTTKELISQFITAMPTFLEGTEDTGAQGHGVDGKGGFNAILHPNERVMTKEQNAMIGGVSNDYVAQVMEQHRIGNYMDGSVLIAKIDNAELVSGLSSLQSEMSEVKKAILNQPRESNNTAEMLSNYMMFENKQTQGGKTTTSRFKVRK